MKTIELDGEKGVKYEIRKSDELNVTLVRIKDGIDKKTGETKKIERILGYYTSVNGAFRSFCEREINNSEEELASVIDRLETFYQKICLNG